MLALFFLRLSVSFYLQLLLSWKILICINLPGNYWEISICLKKIIVLLLFSGIKTVILHHVSKILITCLKNVILLKHVAFPAYASMCMYNV